MNLPPKRRLRVLGDMDPPGNEGFYRQNPSTQGERARGQGPTDAGESAAPSQLDELKDWLQSTTLNVKLPIYLFPSCRARTRVEQASAAIPAGGGWRPIVSLIVPQGYKGVITAVATDLDRPEQFGTVQWRFIIDSMPCYGFSVFTYQFASLANPRPVKFLLKNGQTFTIQADVPGGGVNVVATARAEGHEYSSAGTPGSPASEEKEKCT